MRCVQNQTGLAGVTTRLPAGGNGGQFPLQISTMSETCLESKTKQPTPSTASCSLEHVQRSAAGISPTVTAHQSPSLSLQRALGNHAVGLMLQTKLTVNQPGDMYEQEADRVADQVMRMPEPGRVAASAAAGSTLNLQRKCSCESSGTKCAACAEEQESLLQRSASDPAAVESAPPIVFDALGSPGQPLDWATRSFFEPRFGYDFGNVRVHTDGTAAASARAINALAYTARENVVFATGQYAPHSPSGARLIAHELTHVVQQRSGSDRGAQIRRQQPGASPPQKPDTPKPTPSAGGLQIQVVTADQYALLTGKPADQLPEGKYVPLQEVVLPGAGLGLASPPLPGLPIPESATGILWEGSHVSDFAVVEGQLVARGFRAGLGRHVASDLERGLLGRLLFGRGGGPFTTSLNRGVPGSYANDWLFPYLPGSTAVYRTGTPGEAGQVINLMNQQAAALKGKPYRFSTPPVDNPAYARAFGANPCPPGASNCINLPAEVHEQALGGKNLVLDNNGNPIDIATGEPGSQPGMAKNMDAYINQPEEAFAARGLTRTPIAGPMWARAGAGVIRVGGVVLLVYGAVKTTERIVEASPEERPIVIAEEGGAWGGGFIGNVLGSALGGAFFCAETGPGAFFCAAAFGIAGGVTGSVIGQSAMHDLAKTAVDYGKMTPAQRLDATILLFGTPEQKRAHCQMKEIEDVYDPLCSFP